MLAYADKHARVKRAPGLFTKTAENVDPNDIGKNAYLSVMSEFGKLMRYK